LSIAEGEVRSMLCSIATRLEESQVERIRRLEKDMDLSLVR